MVKKTDTEKVARSVEVKVLVPYVALTVIVTLIIGLVAGYFVSINVHSEARKEVASYVITATTKK